MGKRYLLGKKKKGSCQEQLVSRII